MWQIIEYHKKDTYDCFINRKKYKSKKKATKALIEQLDKTQEEVNADWAKNLGKKWKWKNFDYDFDCKIPWWKEKDYIIAAIKFPDL